MHARIEMTSGILRIFHDSAEPGAPFAAAAAFVADDGTATIKALAATGFNPAHAVAVRAVLAAAGFKRVRWTRKEPDGCGGFTDRVCEAGV